MDVSVSDGVEEVSQHPECHSSSPMLHGLALKNSVSELRTRLTIAKRGTATLPQYTARPPVDFGSSSSPDDATAHREESAGHRVVTITECSPHEESDDGEAPPLADESSDEDETYYIAGRRSIADPFSGDDEDAEAVEYESGSGCSENTVSA